MGSLSKASHERHVAVMLLVASVYPSFFEDILERKMPDTQLGTAMRGSFTNRSQVRSYRCVVASPDGPWPTAKLSSCDSALCVKGVGHVAHPLFESLVVD